MRRRLLDWFDRHARPLPWRTPVREPYATLVAETMLQQTQAARVATVYPRFMTAFPEPLRLASADERDVLLAWQGLGYYRRARFLHAAARIVVEQHGGRLPGEVAALARLPGVGRYTAVAVAAQAFGIPGIAVDGNVRRVGARVLAQGDGAASAGTMRAAAPVRTLSAPPTARLRDGAIEAGLAALLLAGAPPGDDDAARVSEALIELGALVCTPRAPACHRCPLAPACAARAQGDPTRFGRPAPAARAPLEASRALVVRAGTAVALVRRASSGRWGGLWGFPTLALDTPPGGRALDPVEHVLTHRRLRVVPVVVDGGAEPDDATWVALSELAGDGGPVPVAVIDRKLARRVVHDLAVRGSGGSA